MVYKELKVSSDIPASKLHRAFKNDTLSLTAAELRGSGATLHLHPESYAKALKAQKVGKGTRLAITKKEIGYPFKHLNGGGIHGGSIWGKIWGGIKKAFKWAKDSGVLSKVADAAVAPLAAYTGNPAMVATARSGLKTLTGIGIDSDSEKEGGKITFSDVKKHSRRVMSEAKRAYNYAKSKGIITDLVDEGEKYLLSKAEKPEHEEVIKYVRKGIRNKYGVGVSDQKKKLTKGSTEAKEHMAKLRAMRKKGSKSSTAGGSFRL